MKVDMTPSINARAAGNTVTIVYNPLVVDHYGVVHHSVHLPLGRWRENVAGTIRSGLGNFLHPAASEKRQPPAFAACPACQLITKF